jgi:hypothetical protein
MMDVPDTVQSDRDPNSMPRDQSVLSCGTVPVGSSPPR